MESTELRLGNYVELQDGRNDGEIIQVNGIYALNGGHVYDEDDAIHGLKCIKPIPLTEEWLLKFGWVWNNECDSFEKYPNGDSRMHLQHQKVNNSFTMFNYVLNATICKRIWHVHQLQNLYYALTGEELVKS